MSEQKNITSEQRDTAPFAAYKNRYFVAINNENYINGMLIAFTEAEAQNYKSQSLSEVSQEQFESIGPDYQLVDGKIVKGEPLIPVLSKEANQAILFARIRDASEKIQTLADALDFGMGQEGDNERLTAWKKYRVLLSHVDISKPLPEWPTAPLASTAA
ncbi:MULTISPECIES: tail fiber assembly protein [unclassified Pantoea]|uniref:tail fiber assembly protein n=1 Tax=unclassified Pantoea TaxID=2630326 RepID=UPI001F3A14CB|nr:MULTISPECIES: tail fiber assembly protein [unclassified Pantoea]MDU6387152.1 tail fiber assembly protein [Pantoea sp.]